MLIRYKQDEKGKSVPVAKIYTVKEHHINPNWIDRDAYKAIKTLQARGEEAYLVGGAVRDLMLGLIPKDFDITTSASPRQIHKLFWNSRIIGKRFKLVHLSYNGKIIECSTFRSAEESFDGNNNVFGTVDQDAMRRDFTINSLYYDPIKQQVLDFNNALVDFKKKRISSIIDLDTSFREDPVRMIRAIKYSITTGFSLRWNVKRAIKRDFQELGTCSTSRLTEEVNKILSSGHSYEIFNQLNKYKLLVFLLPSYSNFFKVSNVSDNLKELDLIITLARKERKPDVPVSEMLRYLVKDLIIYSDEEMTPRERFKETFRQIKVIISPMTPSNYEVELCASNLLASKGYKVPRGCVRTPKTDYRLQKRSNNSKYRSRRRKKPTDSKARSATSIPKPKAKTQNKKKNINNPQQSANYNKIASVKQENTSPASFALEE